MSKVPEPYTLVERLHRAAQQLRFRSDGLADLLASAAEALEDHDRDVAHAVALERERIAAWLEDSIINECGPEPFHRGGNGAHLTLELVSDLACGHSLIAALRDGAHNEQEVDDE